jgi:polyisoprenyl-phosphate glycosyltransferase
MLMEKEKNKIKYSVVVPCYNSSPFLETLCNQAYEAFGEGCELILVNDFSSDKTEETISKLQETYNFVKGYSFPENLGQIAATLYGISKAKGKITITIDDDLQHSIQSFRILETLLNNENKGVVVATWATDESLVRNTSSTLFRIISSLLILKKTNFRNTAFRLFDSEHNKEIFNYFCSRFWLDPRRILKAHKVGQVNVDHFIQFKRPQSSFQSRIALASKHIFLDTYLINLIIMLAMFYDPAVLVILLAFFLIQKVIREKIKRKRIRVYSEATKI